MKTKELIEKCFASGLVDASNEPYFSWRGCDFCSNGLGATVYDVKAFASLEEAREDKENYYQFIICGDCLYSLTYGE